MTLTAFPTVFDTVVGAFGTEISYEAASAVLAGQVVAVDDSTGTIAPTTAATVGVVGIALYDIPAGTIGAVRVVGVAKTVAAGTIKAGQAVIASTVSAVGPATTAGQYCVGTAIDNATEGQEVRVAVHPFTYYAGA